MELLEVKNLKVIFPTLRGVVLAVNSVNFHQKNGENVGLVGESGAGKTMMGRAFMGLLPYPGQVVEGEIFWNGESLLKKKDKDFRRLLSIEISMIFQDPISALNPLKKIGDQIIEAILLHQDMSRKRAMDHTLTALRSVGIPRPEISVNNFPHQYSGGMLQRVMIALALINDPRLVIADEPTTALDVTIQAQILMLLKNLQEARGMSVLMITHDLGVVAQVCSRIYVMYAGKIVECADTKTIFQKPLHPYTKALLRCAVRMNFREDHLATIPGLMPDLISMPSGCAYHPRCDRSTDICKRKTPAWQEVHNGHDVICFNSGAG